MDAKKLMDYKVDEAIDLFVLLKNADARVAKNGKRFLSITLKMNLVKSVECIGMQVMRMLLRLLLVKSLS